jgi:hypothetical protein
MGTDAMILLVEGDAYSLFSFGYKAEDGQAFRRTARRREKRVDDQNDRCFSDTIVCIQRHR